MERKFSIQHLSPGFELTRDLTVTVNQDGDIFVAVCAELPSMRGTGEAFAMALQDLRDNLVAAFEGGDEQVVGFVKVSESQPPPNVDSSSRAAQSKGTVFVLVNKDSSLEGVVTDQKTAERFKRWSGGGYEERVLDELI